MATYNIAIISSDRSSDSYRNLETALRNMGHTVTGFVAGTAPDIKGFDLIFTTRLGKSVNADNRIKDAIMAGVPAILDGTQDGSGASIGVNGEGPINCLALARNLSSTLSRNILFASNPPSVFSGYQDAQVQVLLSDATYNWNPSPGDYASSAILLASVYGANKAANLLFKKGSATLIGGPIGANVAFASWLYTNGSTGFSSVGLDIISKLIDWAMLGDGDYKITGTVSDSNNQPLQRLLRAFNKSSGDLAGETTSAADGSYTLSLASDDPVTVVCYHDASDTNNSQVKDDIVPILDE